MDDINAGVGVPFCGPKLDFGCICDQGFGEFCTVEGQVGFFGDEGDAAFEVEFAQGLDCADGTTSSVYTQSAVQMIREKDGGSPSDNDNLLVSRNEAFKVRVSLSSFDAAFFAFNVYCAFLFVDSECAETV